MDTNILSAFAPGRPVPQHIQAWFEENTSALFLSVVTISEVEDGLAKAARQGATQKAANLTAWLTAVLHLYDTKILDFDLAAARMAGKLSDRARSQGLAPGYADIIIAATAQRHGHIVLTRNLRHFAPLGVAVVDPFIETPKR